jgi:uncharacterized repeat protein (TIGR01451 family)
VTITVNVAADAPGTVTNTASVAGGGDSNAGNNSASDPTTVLGGPDLTLTLSHSGNFFQGQIGAPYTITVTNSGASPTSGAVVVTNALPAGLVPASATGVGWTCEVDAAVITCERSDPLAPGASYAPVTVTVNVAPNAPASLTNTVDVAGGGDVDSTDNSASDATTILPGPNLSLTKAHTGDFVQGQIGAAYLLTVSNGGGAPSVGTVIVNDVLPAALTPTGAAGAGWTCAVNGNGVQCGRGDPIAPGAGYPLLTVTAHVAADAPPAVTNTALVSGGGDVNGSDNAASDPTTIVAGPDLMLTKSHTATFRQGGRAAADALFYTLTVANVGTAATSAPVTLTDSIPAGLVAASASGTGWVCTVDPQSVTCTRSDALAGGASYPPVQLGVDVESDAPAAVVNTATIAGGGDVQASNNSTSDPTPINRGQNLTITKTHAGDFFQGQTGAVYTVTVTNSGEAPTLGTVTLVDTVPTGLVPTAAAGTGWTCTVSGETVDCTRADPIAAGASYDPVTVTVDVLVDAPPSVANTALVAGGGDVFPTDNVASDATTIASGPDVTITKVHPLGFSPGQTSGVFQIIVSNAGGSPTAGRVDVVDDIPVGLTATAAEGPGWSCEVAVDTVACTRSDPLAPASSTPPITLTVEVDPAVTMGSTLINEANVFITAEGNIGNNSAEDLVLVSLYTLHFAEGATGPFFHTDVGVLNASPTDAANVTFTVFPDGGAAVTPLTFTLPPLGRRSIDLNTLLGGRSGSTEIESDQPIGATRQMTWGIPAYGSTLESGIARTSATWYFAEGATNVYSLYYLLENPNATAANVTLTHFVERGPAPVVQSLTIPPSTRATVLVNDVPGLASVSVATLVAADVPLVAERAMYLNSTTRTWEAGTAASGAIAPSTTWSFAEGATGFFHTYLLLGNPSTTPASVSVTYKLPDGSPLSKVYTVPPLARLTVDLNNDDPMLSSTSVGMEVTSPVPIVAERAMWWQGYPWSEGSSAIGTTLAGSLWAIGEGTEGGPLQASTFVLVANESATPGTVRFTVAYDDGTSEQKDFALVANARLTVRIGEPANFPNTSGKAFSVLVESVTTGMPITVEYARYQTSTLLLDSGGAALANRIR